MTTKRERNIRVAKKRNESRLRKKRWAKEQRRKKAETPRDKGKPAKFPARQGMKRTRGNKGV